MATATNAVPKRPRNMMIGPEPRTSAGPNDSMWRRPPVLRSMVGCLYSLRHLWETADAACAPASFMQKLHEIDETLRTLEHEYWCGRGDLRKHFEAHGLADREGFEPAPLGGVH
jgi:hypothetical protein